MSRTASLIAPLIAAGLLSGCGDGDSPSAEERHESTATPAQAVGEIAAVRTGLAAGLTAYAQGNAAKAERLVGDAYLEHFELVEGPLEERDEELNEELEELISTEIRQQIKNGAGAARVEALVEEAQHELTRAERALRD